jgi:hypothetical protein
MMLNESIKTKNIELDLDRKPSSLLTKTCKKVPSIAGNFTKAERYSSLGHF